MYETSNKLTEQKIEGLQVQKLVQTNALEILSISLEKGTTFPEHTSPKDAELIVLEGDIHFNINGETYPLGTQQHFNFPKEVAHTVLAKKNSKFLIIR